MTVVGRGKEGSGGYGYYIKVVSICKAGGGNQQLQKSAASFNNSEERTEQKWAITECIATDSLLEQKWDLQEGRSGNAKRKSWTVTVIVKLA